MTVRCTASGQVRHAATYDDWDGNRDNQIVCCDCGGTAIVWVRGTDLVPRAKVRAHNAPTGVVPGPFQFGKTGYTAAPEMPQ